MADHQTPNERAKLCSELRRDEEALVLPDLSGDTAWSLGQAVRDLYLQKREESPIGFGPGIAFAITLFDGTVLFQATAGPGVAPDNMEWLKRKTNTVKRFGTSSFLRGQTRLLKGRPLDDPLLGPDYAAHGGAFPLRVRGIAYPVGAIAVSGLQQEDDHMLATSAIRTHLAQRKSTP
ncbi:unnamed protein product [Parajaminaea phylloscopi]